MSVTRRAIVGAFVVGGIALFGFSLFLIGDRRLLFERHIEIRTALTRVTGLQVGTRVRVSGFDAGEVLDVALPSGPSEPFEVRIRLRDDLRPLVRRDSVAAVQTDGIVGSAFIQISRGTDAAPMVDDGDMIAGMDPIEFADLIAAGRQTFETVSEQIVAVTDRVTDTIQPLTDAASRANEILTDAGANVRLLTASAAEATDEARAMIGHASGIVADVRAGRGTIGRLLTDDAAYERWVGVGREAERVAAVLRDTTTEVRDIVQRFGSPTGPAQQTMQTIRDTMTDAREIVADLSEGTEALKRNFFFRGFFRDRGFFDLDSVSREEYVAGALERGDRVALRVWIDAAGLFDRLPSGDERLTDDGRRRVDVAMADLIRYARDNPLVVEGYAGSAGQPDFLAATDRALAVRDYLVDRFRRRVTLTGAMPMGREAVGSPNPAGVWSGVALTLFVERSELER